MNKFNTISSAAILGGQKQAEAAFRLKSSLITETKNIQCDVNSDSETRSSLLALEAIHYTR